MKAQKTARPHLISIALLVGLGLMLVSTHNVEYVRAVASTIVVANGDVAGLIAAINTANNESTNPGPDTIELASSGTYAFAGPHNFEYGPNALPPITSDITINGNGGVLDSTATVRLRFFYVSGGLSFDGANGLPGGKLLLRDLTLRNGKSRGGDAGNGGAGAGMGGAVFNQGQLTLERVTLRDNTATGGSASGGISVGGGGIGQDAQSNNGGGFGGAPLGVGGSGGMGNAGGGGGGGGGGFRPGANGANASVTNGGAGGGTGLLGGAGGHTGGAAGDGAGGGGSLAGGNGGAGAAYGGGGNHSVTFQGGAGGGGVGGGGGGGFGAGGGGFGGGGGRGVNELGGRGGFGGGGGIGALGGFAGGDSTGAALGSAGGGGGLGGAIFNHRGTLTLINSTLSGNIAAGGSGASAGIAGHVGGNGGSGFGGAIFNLNGTVSLINDTLAANTIVAGTAGGGGASGTPGSPGRSDGGAVYNLAFGNRIDPVGTGAEASTAAVSLRNTILANSANGNDLINDKRNGTSPSLNTATVDYDGRNIVQTSAALSGTTFTGVLFSIADPQLGPLAANGGPTPTMAITLVSPANDVGSNGDVPAGVTTDQRGLPRVSGAAVDIGAFELQQGGVLPQFTCPSDITVGTDAGQCSALVSFDVTATGTPSPTIECKIASTVITSPHTFPSGTTIVNCTATSSGSTATCSFSVTVTDREKPLIICSAVVAQSAGSDANCEATVPDVRALVQAQSSDNCTLQSSLVVTQNPAQGSVVSGVGSHPISVTVCDAASPTANCAQCVVAFTVNDLTPTTIGVVTVDKPVLWPPEHQMVDVAVSYTAMDNCSAPMCAISVTSNEPINGVADGDTAPDWAVIDPHHVQVRAERAGNGIGRIYTITVRCTDAAGKIATRTATVMVPHSM